MKKNLAVKPNTTEKNHTGAWRSRKPQVDVAKCIGCSLCSRLCPEGAIKMVDVKGQKKSQINYNYCKGCGLCALECPVKAIDMKGEDK
jgi:2-oxoacid:acceptor oxidoreductase delta subunit (pyruvate/2-ketoisovalerate family)